MKDREEGKIYIEDYLVGRSKQDTRKFLRDFYTGSLNARVHKGRNSTYTWPWYIGHHHKGWETGLEIGCGEGIAVSVGRTKGYELYGIDHAQIPGVWREWGVQKYCCTAEAANLPFKDNEFDVVMIPDVLEHIPEDDIDEVLHEMKRVGINHYYALIAIDYEQCPINNVAYAHITRRDHQWWQDKFHGAGFHIKTIDQFNRNGRIEKVGFAMEKHQPTEPWEIVINECGAQK